MSISRQKGVENSKWKGFKREAGFAFLLLRDCCRHHLRQSEWLEERKGKRKGKGKRREEGKKGKRGKRERGKERKEKREEDEENERTKVKLSIEAYLQRNCSFQIHFCQLIREEDKRVRSRRKKTWRKSGSNGKKGKEKKEKERKKPQTNSDVPLIEVVQGGESTLR